MSGGDLDYKDYIEIAAGIYWVGFADERAGFHCNPYLLVDGSEAVLIDGGDRNEFSTVMLKIMRTGTNPKNITRLIYHHYDPDLCASLPHLEALIGRDDLKVISHGSNNPFIDCYSVKTPKECIAELGFHFEFASGRRLEFIGTPYAHAPGSFVTYDTKTKVLFSSDIFGSYDAKSWSLYSRIGEVCATCAGKSVCPVTSDLCQVESLREFHRRVMTSEKALRFALGRLENLDVSMIAPQHGSILDTPASQGIAFERLKSLVGVGIDGCVERSAS